MSLTAEEIRECTMIALDQPPFWPVETEGVFKFTITVDGTNSRPNIVRFEDDYYTFFSTFSGIIFWGDGQEEDILISSFNRLPSHTFSNGTYEIKMKGHFSYKSISSSYKSTRTFLRKPALLDSVNSKFPKAEVWRREYKDGEYVYIWNPADPSFSVDFGCAFYNCINLQTVPEYLFINHPNTTRIQSLFRSCRNLRYIPEKIFSYFDNIANVYNPNANGTCNFFHGCESITVIPNGLFDKFRSVESFESCLRDVFQ